MDRPALLQYENYRDFLRDWYAWMKEHHEGFSYRTFSRWAGFKSPNQLQLIIQGKRNITTDTMPAFLRILKLNRRERAYFELLVPMNQATTAAAQAGFLKEISACFKRFKENLRHGQYEYLMRWYYPVIRELVTTKGFKVERHRIARRVGHGVTPRQVDEAIEKLLQLGLLVRNEDGTMSQADRVVTTGPETTEAASYFYHEQMIRLALDALAKQLPAERNFSGITLACREEDVEEISQILTDCRRQVLSYLENRRPGPDDQVHQLNLQLFRVTGKGEGGGR